MSLILAHHTPKGAVVVADTQWMGDPVGMARFAPKIHRVGDWIVGFSGAEMPARLILRDLALTASVLEPGPALQKAFDVVVPQCGPTSQGNFPDVNTDTMIVHKGGIICMDGHGTVRDGGTFLAIGCGREFAQGWYDAVAADAPGAEGLPAVLKHCMDRAKHHFPGIGGETTVLRLEFT